MLLIRAVFRLDRTEYREKNRAARRTITRLTGFKPLPPKGFTMMRIPSRSKTRARMLFQRMTSWRMRAARTVTKMGLPEKMTATTLAWPKVTASWKRAIKRTTVRKPEKAKYP